MNPINENETSSIGALTEKEWLPGSNEGENKFAEIVEGRGGISFGSICDLRQKWSRNVG